MGKKIHFTIASLVIVAARAFTGIANQTTHKGVHKRPAKVRKKVQKRIVKYACPMHPDMHSKSPGECPKCGMDLVVERRRS